jgi:hypothetical protein
MIDEESRRHPKEQARCDTYFLTGPKAVMIAHQNPGMNTPPRHAASLSKTTQKNASVFVVQKNGFPSVPPRHDVIKGSRKFNSNTAGQWL